jgi:hypothetical protein
MRTRSALTIAAVAGILVLSAVVPSASALFVQGHSPITILLTDPSGNQFGCTSSGCNCPNSSPCVASGTDFVNSLGSSPDTLNLNPTLPECTPECVYFVNGISSSFTNSLYGTTYGDTYIDIPNPASGIWGITFYGNPGSETTTTEGSGAIIGAGTFAITANTCGEASTQPAHPSGINTNNNEGMGTCSVMCLIPPFTLATTTVTNTYRSTTVTNTVPYPQPVEAHIFCDQDDMPIATSVITLSSGTVAGTSSGSGSFGVSSGGVPYTTSYSPPPLSTPEFSYGIVTVMAVLFMALLMLRRYSHPGEA